MKMKDMFSGTVRNHTVPIPGNTSLEVTGLERYTNYSIQVAGYTVKGVGIFSEPIIVITDEDGKLVSTLFYKRCFNVNHVV